MHNYVLIQYAGCAFTSTIIIIIIIKSSTEAITHVPQIFNLATYAVVEKAREKVMERKGEQG